MTDKERAAIAELVRGHEAEIGEAAGHARGLFTGGLAAFLEPRRFETWVNAWADRARHGGVPLDARAGVALRADDMRTLAPGLLAPGHYYLSYNDLPTIACEVAPFLRRLIARPDAMAGTSRKQGDAVAQATRHIGDLAELATRAWNLRSTSVELYQHALLGDASSCRSFVNRIDDPSMAHEAIAVIAALQIVWAAADVHRTAAYNNHKVQLGYVPFFLRSFLRTGTAAEYVKLMRNMRGLRSRLFALRDDGQEIARERARVTRKGVPLAAMERVLSPLEGVLTRQNITDIRDHEDWMTQETNRIVGAAERCLAGASEQMTRYQLRHAGLSELAALMVTAYRFAEREAALLRVIANPPRPDLLWSQDRRFPAHIDQGLLSRATAIHDAYRRHIMRDQLLSDDTADERSPAQYARASSARAQDFLVRLSAAEWDDDGRMSRAALSSDEFSTAHMLDLSHRVRSRGLHKSLDRKNVRYT